MKENYFWNFNIPGNFIYIKNISNKIFENVSNHSKIRKIISIKNTYKYKSKPYIRSRVENIKEFNKLGLKINELTFESGIDYEFLLNTNIVYDSLNRLKIVNMVDCDHKSINECISFDYDSNRNLKESNIEYHNDKYFTALTNQYVYNNQNIHKIISTDKQNNISDTLVYTYWNNLVVRNFTLTFTHGYPNNPNYYTEIFKLDEHHNLFKFSFFDYLINVPSDLMNIDTCSADYNEFYIYNKSRRLIENENEYDPPFSEKRIYKYNSDGNIESSVDYDNDNKEIVRQEFFYKKYDGLNEKLLELIKIIDIDSDSEKDIVIYYEFY